MTTLCCTDKKATTNEWVALHDSLLLQIHHLSLQTPDPDFQLQTSIKSPPTLYAVSVPPLDFQSQMSRSECLGSLISVSVLQVRLALGCCSLSGGCFYYQRSHQRYQT